MFKVSRLQVCAAAVAVGALGTAALVVSPSARANEVRAGFTAQCPTTDFPKSEGDQGESLGVLATTILSTVAGTLVDTGIAAVKKKVTPNIATSESKFLQNGLYVYRGSPDKEKVKDAKVEMSTGMGCLVVAVGRFSDAEADAAETFNLPFKSDRNAAVATRLMRNALNVRSAPQFALYFEAARKKSPDKTAVTWQPVRVYVGEYLNEGFFAGKSRSTQVEFRFYKPAADKPFYSQEFAFDNVTKPFDKGPLVLHTSNAGTWGVLPAPPNLPEGFEPNETGRPFDPFTLEVRVVETPKPYMLAAAFADAVDKSKDDIKTMLKEEINPDLKRKNELSSESSTLGAISDYLTAFSSAKEKCVADKKKEPDGLLACSIALDSARVAHRKAELACKTQNVATCGSMPTVSQAGTTGS